MSSIKKKKNSNKYIILFFICIMVMIISLILILKITKPKTKEEQKKELKDNTAQSQENEEIEEEKIENLSEQNRMKRYIGIFLENIENKNYEAAYEVLNEDFKKTYFPKIEDFKKYAQKYFNSSIGLEYEDIERFANNKTGNIYIIWTIADNLLSLKKSDEEKEIEERTKFVIIEYDYNNYEMSFSVMSEE